jgi:RNA polymerase sigma-32 factor
MSETLPTIKSSSLPAISDDYSLARYIDYIKKYPILTASEEYEYATAWTMKHDSSAAEKLITSHLRMVVAVAYEFKNYGIPVSDLIASGNLGLMQALQKFAPEKGFRFSTYAMFWIKAEMYDLILSNWSMVKIGTSANQKRVFFNLSKAKRALGIMSGNISPDEAKQIADYLDVSEKDVSRMAQRMGARDVSLNAPAHQDSDSTDLLSNLEDKTESIEDRLSKFQMRKNGMALLRKHLTILSERDRAILIARRMSDPVRTLEQLAGEYGISRERVRQIEERAFAKLQTAILAETKK